MRAHKIQRPSGQELFALVDGMDCPLPCPTAFITSELYTDNHSTNSMEGEVYHLKFFLDWAESKGICIEDRVASAEWLSADEIEAFKETSLVKSKNAFAEPANEVPISKTITERQLSNAVHDTEIKVERVTVAQTNLRRRMAMRYVNFLVELLHGHDLRETDEKAVNAMYGQLLRGQLTESRAAKASRAHGGGGLKSKIPDVYFFAMVNCIHVDASNNPFGRQTGSRAKDKAFTRAIRERNRLIIELATVSGARRGAIAKLKITDIDFSTSCIEITRTPIDPSDPRKKRAQQKTLAHTAYLPPRLHEDLQHYINETRAKTPGALMHEFLFVSHSDTRGTQGHPLSLSSINALFKQLSDVVGYVITPHKLRHKWNELFSDLVDREGIPTAKADKARKWAMGWVKTSTAAEVYNRFKDGQHAMQLQMLLQDAIFNCVYDQDVPDWMGGVA